MTKTADLLDQVNAALATVSDPELHRPLPELGMVDSVDISGSVAKLHILLTISGCPMQDRLRGDITEAVSQVSGISTVEVIFGVMSEEQRNNVKKLLRGGREKFIPFAQPESLTRVIGVASGKGGVGKSSVTVNLAAALAAAGKTVGVLDADIWGFSIPRMLGMPDRLEAAAVPGHDKPMIIPNERVIGNGLLKVVSTGMLVEDEGTALMWRGLMLTKAVEQFLNDVNWGHLDYLLIDMPPGTGDVQMGLARMLPRTDLLIVTTPAVSAQKVAIRAADMARRSFLRVAGVIENMSEFTCDHGESYALFGTGGGQALADEVGVELLGQIPIEPAVAAGGDNGEPLVLTSSSEAARIFTAIAARIIADTPEVEEMAGCSARDEDVVVTVRRSQNLQA